jgi:hypothetical protein
MSTLSEELQYECCCDDPDCPPEACGNSCC